MSKNMTTATAATAAEIAGVIAHASAELEAARSAYLAFAVPCPSAPRGIMIDLTRPGATEASARLGQTSEALKVAKRRITTRCPVEERVTCSRCGGEGRIYHSTLMGGICLRCNGMKWTPSLRWVRACEPAKP